MQPVVLIGDQIRLEPLAIDHAPALHALADDEVFAHLPYPAPPDLDAMRRWISQALALRASGTRMPFAIIQRSRQRAVGTTSYWFHDPDSGSVEIGSTWMARPLWRTGTNREAKSLLIEHAFTALGCSQIIFRTDIANTGSQRAIESLGATQQRVVPHDLQRSDGTWRTSVYYVLTEARWNRPK